MEKDKLCPKCGNKLVDIVYGMPSSELFEKSKRKEVYLGGCEIILGMPQEKYHCYNCNLSFYKDMTSVDSNGPIGK